MRIQEEQRVKEDKIRKEAEEKENRRLHQIGNLHHKLDNAPTENIHPVMGHLTVIRSELSHYKDEDFLSTLTNVIAQQSDAVNIRVVRAVLFMLDYKKAEFYKHSRLVRVGTLS